MRSLDRPARSQRPLECDAIAAENDVALRLVCAARRLGHRYLPGRKGLVIALCTEQARAECGGEAAMMRRDHMALPSGCKARTSRCTPSSTSRGRFLRAGMRAGHQTLAPIDGGRFHLGQEQEVSQHAADSMKRAGETRRWRRG